MSYELREYLTENGKSYFSEWFNKIGATAAAKISAALYKLERGLFSDIKAVGSGVLEFRINSGPGYRIYFAKLDKHLILLLVGGTKSNQHKDIELAISLLKNYKRLSLH